MLKILMGVICLVPPHNIHLIRLYSCPQNRFQISAKCFWQRNLNFQNIYKKQPVLLKIFLSYTCSANNWRNCPHQIIFSPAAQCVCINTKQKWWPVVWPRLQWDVKGAIKACDFIDLFTDWPNFSRSLPELSLFILWVCSSEGSLPVILRTLVDTWDFFENLQFPRLHNKEARRGTK